MSTQRDLDLLRAVRSGDVCQTARVLARDREETAMENYEDLQEHLTGRQAKIAELQQQIQGLQARLDARDAIIRSQQAQIARLRAMLAQQSRVVIVGRVAEA